MNLPSLIVALVLAGPGGAHDFKIVPDSLSPDKSVALAVRPVAKDTEVVFYDVAKKTPLSDELSKETVFDLIGWSQSLDKAIDKPSYGVAWSSDSRRVAVSAGFHQFSGFTIYELRQGHPTELTVPDVEPQWKEIARRLEPFIISKRWRENPVWVKPDRLSFNLTGCAYRKDAKDGDDIIDYSYQVTVQFDDQGHGTVTGLESAK